jgi:hypothetical protein
VYAAVAEAVVCGVNVEEETVDSGVNANIWLLLSVDGVEKAV